MINKETRQLVQRCTCICFCSTDQVGMQIANCIKVTLCSPHPSLLLILKDFLDGLSLFLLGGRRNPEHTFSSPPTPVRQHQMIVTLANILFLQSICQDKGRKGTFRGELEETTRSLKITFWIPQSHFTPSQAHFWFPSLALEISRRSGSQKEELNILFPCTSSPALTSHHERKIRLESCF